MRGRGKKAAHKRQMEKGDLHELHFDYAFMGDENEAGKSVKMLVVRERYTGMTMSTAIPSKTTGKFTVERIMAFLKELGVEHLDVIAKSDQEPSVKCLLEEVGKRKSEFGGRWIVEH